MNSSSRPPAAARRCNGVAISASAGRAIDGAKLAGPKRVLDRISEAHPQAVQLPRIGALALRLARVAHGGVDVAIAGGNSHDWDLAAADLLVHEAGGLLTDFDGGIARLQSGRSGAQVAHCRREGASHRDPRSRA